MANELIKQNYKNIANAIRAKTGENGLMTAEEMPAKIESIETGITPSGTKNITSNGNGIDVAEFAAVNVNVPNPSSGTLNIYSNGSYNVTNYANAEVSISTQMNTLQGENYPEDFLKAVLNHTKSSVDVSNIFTSSGDPNKGGYIYANTNELNLEVASGWSVMGGPVGNMVDNFPGGHNTKIPSSEGSIEFIVVGMIAGDYRPSQINITLQIEYYSYSGPYTEDELANLWSDALEGTMVMDLNGIEIGTVYSVNATVTTREDC